MFFKTVGGPNTLGARRPIKRSSPTGNLSQQSSSPELDRHPDLPGVFFIIFHIIVRVAVTARILNLVGYRLGFEVGMEWNR